MGLVLLWKWMAVVVLVAGLTSAALALNTTDYLEQRQMMLAQERTTILGHDQVLTPEEEQLNQLLMAAKRAEMDDGFEIPLNFLPAKNFMTVRDEIEASDVFKMIKMMPKGSALHVHDSALAPALWVVEELTYWPDLYVCYTPQDLLLLKFFQTPDTTCAWRLVSDVRASYPSPEEFDTELFERISYFTNTPDEEYIDVNSAWEAFEKYFTTISELLTYRPAWESYLYQALLEFSKDNVLYVEYRGLSLLYELNGTVLTEVETMAVHQRTAQRFLDDHPDDYFGTRFIYAPSRRVENSTMENYVSIAKELKTHFPDYIAGFDLVGQEDKGVPLIGFVESLLQMSEANISVFYHAGETDWMGMTTDENIIDALLLNASRIGHGYAITKHPEAKLLAREKDVPLEVCPISNQVLKLVDDLRNHPAAGLVAEGFPIVVSSDDPGAWGSVGISHDVYEAFMAFGGAHADLRFLKQIAINSINYSSLQEDAKFELMLKWVQKWDEFVSTATRLFSQTGKFFPRSSTVEEGSSSSSSVASSTVPTAL